MRDSERAGDVLAEWYEREETGRAESREAILEAHPDLAGPLRAHLEALDALSRAFPPDLAIAAAGGALPAAIGEFRIVREIGRGGMGVVYEAEQGSLRRRVALKVVHPGAAMSRRGVERFRREARAAARLHHTNLVPVHAMGEDGGVWWFAMELVEGRTLDRVVEDLRGLRGLPSPATGAAPAAPGSGAADVPPSADPATRASDLRSDIGSADDGRGFYERVARCFAGAADALEVAHAAGVVHRDVKPSNLILTGDGVLKVMDFGLARVEGEEVLSTLTGAILGTPQYMSPEQASGNGAPLDGRTDVYSLGATLYEVLTLAPPFPTTDLASTVRAVLSADPAAPRRRDRRIPRDLETIVVRALEKDRDRRYRTAGDLANDLRLFAEGATIRAKRIGPLGRLRRRIRRHKALATVTTLAVLAGAGVVGFAVDAARETRARRDMEYDGLVARADATLAGAQSVVEACDVDCEASREARDLYARAVDLSPDRWEAYYGRATCAGLLAERLRDLEAATERGLSLRTARLARAYVYWVAGEADASKQEEWAATALPDAGSPTDACLEGRLLLGWGKYAEAVALFSRAIRDAAPGSALWTRARIERATALERTGEREAAFQDLAVASGGGGVTPPGLRIRLAALWRRIGHPDRAEIVFRETLREVAEGDRVAEWNDLCNACRQPYESAWMDEATAEAARRHPEDPSLLFARSLSLAGSGKAREALEVLDRVIAARPGRAHPLAHRAWALIDLDRPSEALDACDQALRYESGFVEAIYGRGLALRRLGRMPEAEAAFREAIGLEPWYTAARTSLGVLLCDDLHRPQEAEEQFLEVARFRPDDARVRRNLGIALEAQGRTDEALAAYRRATVLDPAFADAWISLATSLTETGDRVGATDAWRRAATLEPTATDSWIVLGNLLAEAADFAGAEEAFRRVLAIGAIDSNAAAAHYNLGNALRAQGRRDDAITAYRAALQLDAHLAAAHANLGLTLLDGGELQAAEIEFRSALRENDRLGPARVGLAMALERTGRPEAALAEYEAALRIDEADADARLGRGVVLARLQRLDDGIAEIRRVIASKRNLFEAHRALALALADRGDAAGALENFRTAVAIDPSSAQARFDLGWALRGADDHRGAAREFAEACRLAPERAVLHFVLGATLLSLDDLEGSVRATREAVRLRPDHADAHFNLGLALLSMGKPGGAIESFDEVVRLQPSRPSAHYWRGQCLEGQGLLPAALLAYDRAVALAPSDARSHGARAHVLTASGRFDDALEALGKAAEAEPKDVWTEWDRLELLLGLKRHAAVVEASERALARFPGAPQVLRPKATALRALGRSDEAKALAADATKGAPPRDGLLDFAHLRAIAGDRAGALQILDGYSQRWSPGEMHQRARIHAVLDDAEAAVAWLAKAAEAGWRLAEGLALDPEFASVAADPRLAPLAERVRGR